MVDLVAARADGILAAFTKRLRAAPQFPGSRADNALAQRAWLSGYDAEREFQDRQLDFPMGKNTAYIH